MVPIESRQRNLRGRIWLLLSDASSSKAAQVVAAVVMVMILLSTLSFVIQTLPQFVATESPAFEAIENLTISVFTVEFVLRLFSTPDCRGFWTTALNWVDFFAIAPFYFELVFSSGGSGSSAVIRLIRLVRIFRVLKVSRYLPWVRVFVRAMVLSLQPLLMLVFVVLIAMVVFSSAIYYTERGSWDASTQLWMRSDAAASPFQSIPASMWWCIVTMSTVGYGDVYPVTPLGRLVASVAALAGILVLAIPITVISTNFNAEYSAMNAERARLKARMLLMRRHLHARTTGLDAVLEEVEDLVQRNTDDFQTQVQGLFEQARAELTEEIQEVVRMAYERRRQLHLAALAAGRVQASASPQQELEQERRERVQRASAGVSPRRTARAGGDESADAAAAAAAVPGGGRGGGGLLALDSLAGSASQSQWGDGGSKADEERASARSDWRASPHLVCARTLHLPVAF